MTDNQIFNIRGSAGRFADCYEERGYLPPLVPHTFLADSDSSFQSARIIPPKLPAGVEELSIEVEGIKRDIEQQRRRWLHLEKKLYEHLDASKPKKGKHKLIISNKGRGGEG